MSPDVSTGNFLMTGASAAPTSSSKSKIHPQSSQFARRALKMPSDARARANSQITRWAGSQAKRVFDICVAVPSLLVLTPVLAATALAVKLSSSGPVLFAQTRSGRNGRPFTIFKFRTMREDSAFTGPSVTKVGDDRLTPLGAFLRRSKLDELPQLLNVIRGDMSFVGPRPKVLHHQREPLPFRPGITGAASLAFRREEELLSRVPDHLLDEYQIEYLTPLKNQLDLAYMQSSTLVSDLRVILQTLTGKHSTVEVPPVEAPVVEKRAMAKAAGAGN